MHPKTMLSGLLSVLSVVVVYGVILLAGLWFWYCWTNRQLIREAEKLPCVIPRWPIVGSIPLTIGGLQKVGDVTMRILREAGARSFNTSVAWLGPHPMVIVQGASDIKKLFNSSNALQKGYEEEEYAAEFLKYGLLTAPVDHWRMTRKYMNRVFHPRNLDHMNTTFNRNCQELVTNFEQYVDKGFVNIWQNVMDVAVKNICGILFDPDTNIDSRTPEFRRMLNIMEAIPIIMSSRIIYLWLRNDAVYNFVFRKEIKELRSAFKDFINIPLKEARERINKKLEKRIDPKAKMTEEGSYSEIETVVGAYKKIQELVDENINDNHLFHEIITFFVAGSTSFSTALCSCLVALAQHQDIQENLHAEIISVVGKTGDVSDQDLTKMPYLDRVIKETNRRFTIIPFTSRRSQEEIKLSQVTIPADTSIFIGLAGLLLDPQTYPEPLKFDPDRFLPERRTDKDLMSYMPFSAGTRNCVAKKYTETLMKMFVIHVLRKFQLTTNMDIQTFKRTFIIILSSSEGYHLSFKKRV